MYKCDYWCSISCTNIVPWTSTVLCVVYHGPVLYCVLIVYQVLVLCAVYHGLVLHCVYGTGIVCCVPCTV